MAKTIMIQGTMSNAGKSLIAAGLCRIFAQDGYKTAPFKSQNMALNSYITKEGLEIGRAQAMQAEAAMIEPTHWMNPILLKPTSSMGSQVIVNGEVYDNLSAQEYYKMKDNLAPEVMKAFNHLSEENDIIVIEGAGSPAEINLAENDIVNMGMAKMAKAPVLLVGDIDRGGVFAQLIGTVELLEEDEKAMVKGLIINKFRGDKTILDPGVEMLEERSRIPVVGVAPYLDIQVEDEDSLTERFDRKQEAGEEDPELKAQLEQLEAEKTAMEEKLTELKANLDKMELEAKAAEAEIQKNQTKIEAGLTQINEGLPAVEAGIAQIEEGIPVLQDNIQKLTDVLTQGDAAILTASRQIDQAKSAAD